MGTCYGSGGLGFWPTPQPLPAQPAPPGRTQDSAGDPSTRPARGFLPLCGHCSHFTADAGLNHNPEIVTRAQVENRTLIRVSHPGTPKGSFLLKVCVGSGPQRLTGLSPWVDWDAPGSWRAPDGGVHGCRCLGHCPRPSWGHWPCWAPSRLPVAGACGSASGLGRTRSWFPDGYRAPATCWALRLVPGKQVGGAERLPEPPGRVPPASPRSWGRHGSLACGRVPPVPASVVKWWSPPVSQKNTCHWI